MWSKVRNFRTLLSFPVVKLTNSKILITTDLGLPSFDSSTRKLIQILSPYRVPLTVFSPNGPEDDKSYKDLKKLVEFADASGVTVELSSHSLQHDSLAHKEISEIVSIIGESIGMFRKAGIPVDGFRSPYLSTEGTYDEILKHLDKDILSYDSSVLFERNLFYSRLHDLFPRKCPHRIGDIWELPLSCLDDFHLFDSLNQTDQFVSAYWKRKVDVNIRNHHYFLLLVHPPTIVNHARALEELIQYCESKYSSKSFTTCHELALELSRLNVRGKYPE